MALDRHPSPQAEQVEGQVREQKPARELCSATGELQLIGSAWNNTRWIAIESNNSWGDDPIANGVLGEASAAVGEYATAAGVEPLFIRQPGRVEDTGRYTAFLSNTQYGDEWCERIEFSDPHELLEIDLAKLDRPSPKKPVFGGERVFSGAPVSLLKRFIGGKRPTDAVALVCTNGQVDVCCAIKGRPLAAALFKKHPGNVYESNHFGGHRFAPVIMVNGRMYARIDAEGAEKIMATVKRGEIPLTGYRGHTGLNEVGQVAEGKVLEILSGGAETVRADLTVKVNDAEATVTERDGRMWQVTTKEEILEPRLLTCKGEPEARKRVILDKVTEVSACRRG